MMGAVFLYVLPARALCTSAATRAASCSSPLSNSAPKLGSRAAWEVAASAKSASSATAGTGRPIAAKGFDRNNVISTALVGTGDAEAHWHSAFLLQGNASNGTGTSN